MTFSFFKISKYLLLLPMIGVMFVTTSTLFPFIVGKYVWFRSAVLLALIFFLLGLLFEDREDTTWKRVSSLWKSPLVISVFVFLAIFLISGFFGVDPANSFWSNFERGEGGLQMICFSLYFFLLLVLNKEEKDWHRLFGWGIAGGVLMAGYGFLAGIGADLIGPKFGTEGYRFQGSIGNPAYVATYAIFLMFYSAYLFVKKYGAKLRSGGGITSLFFFLLFLGVFFSAATRGGFVGLIVSIVAFLGYIGFASAKWRKKFLLATGILVILFGGIVVMSNTQFAKDLPGSRLFDLSVRATTFEHRMIMWKTAWDGFLERPLLGWGPENFLQVFDRHFNTKYYVPSQGFGAWFDRAHSIYFDYLSQTGILGFLSYFGIFATFYILILKKSGLFVRKSESEKSSSKLLVTNHELLLENALLFSLPLSYLVQGIVLFDVSIIYLNLFVFFALSAYRLANSKEQMANNKKR